MGASNAAVGFWDRPPEVIHAELCDPRRMHRNRPGPGRASSSLDPRLDDLLRASVSELTAAERQFIRSLPIQEFRRWRNWLGRYRTMPEEQRVETMTGWFVGHVAKGGPDILAGVAIQDHLVRLQHTMDTHPTLQVRKAARRQLHRIVTASLPSFRNTADRVSPRAVLTFYDRLRSRCLAILAARQPEAAQMKALRALPQIGRISAEALRDAHCADDRPHIRAILIEATGRAFSRRPTAVRGLMARARRDRKAKRGERRYCYWLAAQGLGEPRRRQILAKYPHLHETLRLKAVSPRDQI
jgi:hypothetical protein